MKNTDKNNWRSEVWSRDQENPDLWHGKHGLIVNTAALNECKDYCDIILSQPDAGSFQDSREQMRQLAL